MNQKLTFIFGICLGYLFAFCYYTMEWAMNATNTVAKIKHTDIIKLSEKRSQLGKSDHQRHADATTIPSGNPSSSDITSDTKKLMEAIQSERQYNFRRGCERIIRNIPEGYYPQHNFYSKNYKLSVCHIQKCGYSSWLRAILVMDDYFSVEEYLKGKIFGAKVMRFADNTATLRSIENRTVARRVWKETFKIILVRNPFSRLVSGYHGKMVPNQYGFTSYYEKMSRRINKDYKSLRENENNRLGPDNGTATFEDFINYLLHENIGGEEHFQLYTEICKPCASTYDYIAKFETLNEDMEYLRNRLHISPYHRKAFFPKGSFKTDPEKTRREFEKIPKTLAIKLFKKYRRDFDIFGYDMPSWLF